MTVERIDREMLELQLQGTAQELAETKRNLQITDQARLDAQAELVNLRVRDAATCSYVAAHEREDGEARFLHSKLLSAYRATTPSETPATHVVVAVERLAQLEEMEGRAQRLARDLLDPASRQTAEVIANGPDLGEFEVGA